MVRCVCWWGRGAGAGGGGGYCSSLYKVYGDVPLAQVFFWVLFSPALILILE